MNILDNKNNILVVGLGARTGLMSANFLAARGFRVTVSDNKGRDALAGLIARLDHRVIAECGNQGPALLARGFDLLVLSPGVPKTIPLVAAAIERGIPVIAEIELAYGFSRGSIIAITGTDGKTTTTSLVGHILKEVGMHTLVGGNIGIPYIAIVDESTDDTVTVLELSSFQLESIERFRPDVSAILNITPDHLDRYPSMDAYAAAKFAIAKNQTANDTFVYFRDDVYIPERCAAVRARTRSFSTHDAAADIYISDNGVCLREDGCARPVLDPSRMRIIGIHNIQNAMAALLMVDAVLQKTGRAVPFERLAEACYSFNGLPHRMEQLGEFEGRLFINDSKATTVGAVEMALAGIDRPVALILGGRTKGDDYSRLSAAMTGRVSTLVLIGESSDEFSRIFTDFNQVRAGSMDDALVAAMQSSRAGDVVLLSPSCASFDMYTSYEERGDRFRDAVRRLRTGELAWT